MEVHFGVNPALPVALALAAGVISISIARHLRLPGPLKIADAHHQLVDKK